MMTLRIFLKDSITGVHGFKKHSDTRATLPGEIYVAMENGRWYWSTNNILETVPPSIRNYVEAVSLHDEIPIPNRRETGIYAYNSATAELTKEFQRDCVILKMRISAKKIKDAIEIRQMIREGSIRPTRSFEGEQVGKSQREIREEFECLKAENEKLLKIVLGITLILSRKNAYLTNLISEISRRSFFFFFRKKSVLDKLNEILNLGATNENKENGKDDGAQEQGEDALEELEPEPEESSEEPTEATGATASETETQPDEDTQCDQETGGGETDPAKDATE